MMKRTRILNSFAAAAVFLSAQPASAQQGEPAYHTTFYTDSSYSTEVGHLQWTGCNRWGQPTYQLVGTKTYYTQDELSGYCEPRDENGGGGPQPVG